MPNGDYPNMAHAGCYAETLHYLKAVAAMGGAAAKKSGRDTVAMMKSMPTDDDAFGKGSVRADGRGVFPAYQWRVKKPSESKMAWDVFNPVLVSPPSEVIHPLNDRYEFPTKV